MFIRRKRVFQEIEENTLKTLYCRTRKQVEFIKKQYRSGRRSALLDSLSSEEAIVMYPLIIRSVEVLGIYCKVQLWTGGVIYVDFKDYEVH